MTIPILLPLLPEGLQARYTVTLQSPGNGVTPSSRENILKKCAKEQPKPGIRPNINSGSAVPIVDIHVYVAPDVDDGERDVHELIELLKLAEKQGVADVFCNSHNSVIEDSETERLNNL